jgi:hypothetical protein
VSAIESFASFNDKDDDDYYDEDDDDDTDEDDEEDEEVKRAVLLFNAWSDEGPPPRDVKTGYATALSISPDGPEGEQRLIEEWEEDYGVDAKWIHCNTVSEWSQATLETKDCALSEKLPANETKADGVDSKVQLARVHLMGEQNRRLYSEDGTIPCSREASVSGCSKPGSEGDAAPFDGRAVTR